MLAEFPLIGFVAPWEEPTVTFASKGARWILNSGGDAPPQFLTLPDPLPPPTGNRTRTTISLADGAPELRHALFALANVTVIPLSSESSDPSPHGTHLAAVMAGNTLPDSGLSAYNGIGGDVNLVVTETNAADLAAGGMWRHWKAAADAGSVVHVDPWGTVPSLSSRESLWYTFQAHEIDEFFWRHRNILNVRSTGVPATRGSSNFLEISAKNAFFVNPSFNNAVDSLEQFSMFFLPTKRPQCEFYSLCNASLSETQFCELTDRLELMPHDRWFCRFRVNMSALAFTMYSGESDLLYSGAYLQDGRIRPHALVPGTGIVSAVPGAGSPLGLMSGSSVSAAVAGATAALITDYLASDVDPPELGSRPSTTPASLLRALLLASANQFAFAVTSPAELPMSPDPGRLSLGYGRPQINLLFPPHSEHPDTRFSLVILADEQTSFEFDEDSNPAPFVSCFGISKTGGLVKVVLAWPDPPAAYLSTATMVNQLHLAVLESNSGVDHVDTLQSGNEQMISFSPTSLNLQVTVRPSQLIHNGSFSLVVVTSPGTLLSTRECQTCVPGTKTPCDVPGGNGQATCGSSGFPGDCRVSSCDTGRVPTASTSSCKTLPSMFVLTTAMSAAVILLVVLCLLCMLALAAYLGSGKQLTFTRIHLLSIMRAAGLLLLGISSFATLSALLAAYAGFLTSSAMDKAQDPTSPLKSYRGILVAVIGVNIGQILSSVSLAFLQSCFGAIGSSRLRRRVISFFALQSIASVATSAHQLTGQILVPCSSIMGRIPALASLATGSLSKLGIGAIILFSLEWRLAFAAVACIVFLSCWTVGTTQSTKFVGKFYNKHLVRYHSILVSSVSLIDWVRGSNIHFPKLYDAHLQRIVFSTISMNTNSLVTGQVASGLVEITAISVFCAALRSLQLGQLTFGLLMVYFMWMSQSIGAFQGLVAVVNGWFALVADSSALLERINEKKRETGELNLAVTADCRLHVEKLGFHYPNSSVGFEGLNLIVRPRHLSLLMGPSGVGKSSLLRILVRITQPDTGRVLLNEIDIRLLTESALFAALTLIEQDVMLKNGTILHNVCIGIDEEELLPHIVASAESIGAAEWIAASPLGWLTPVTSGGTVLSGGQRKLIGILRALARDPPVLLADEVTAGLDPARASKVLSTLKRRGHTVLMTTHQLELVPFADFVYSLSASGAELWAAPQASIQKSRVLNMGASRMRRDAS